MRLRIKKKRPANASQTERLTKSSHGPNRMKTTSVYSDPIHSDHSLIGKVTMFGCHRPSSIVSRQFSVFLLRRTPVSCNSKPTLVAVTTNIGEFEFDPENEVSFDKTYSNRMPGTSTMPPRLLLRNLDTPPRGTGSSTTSCRSFITRRFGRHPRVLPEHFRSSDLHFQQAVPVGSGGHHQLRGMIIRTCDDFDVKNMKIDQLGGWC